MGPPDPMSMAMAVDGQWSRRVCRWLGDEETRFFVFFRFFGDNMMSIICKKG